MKIGDVIYSTEYDFFGTLVEINHKEAVIDVIHREASNIHDGDDHIYCDISKCEPASDAQLYALFEV